MKPEHLITLLLLESCYLAEMKSEEFENDITVTSYEYGSAEQLAIENGIIGVVLDALNVPRDNTLDYCIDDETGDYPPGAFSREWLEEEWWDKEHPVSIAQCQQYIEWVKTEMKRLCNLN